VDFFLISFPSLFLYSGINQPRPVSPYMSYSIDLTQTTLWRAERARLVPWLRTANRDENYSHCSNNAPRTNRRIHTSTNLATTSTTQPSMGKHVKKRKIKPRISWKQPLPTQFDCPVCREGSCYVVMDMVGGFGIIKCPKCEEAFRTKVNALSEPIDVYFAWTDTMEDTGEELPTRGESLRKKEEPDSDGYSDEILKDEESDSDDGNTTKKEEEESD